MPETEQDPKTGLLLCIHDCHLGPRNALREYRAGQFVGKSDPYFKQASRSACFEAARKSHLDAHNAKAQKKIDDWKAEQAAAKAAPVDAPPSPPSLSATVEMPAKTIADLKRKSSPASE